MIFPPKLMVRHCRLIHIGGPGEAIKYLRNPAFYEDKENGQEDYAMVVNQDGTIRETGPDAQIFEKYRDEVAKEHIVDAKGNCVIPGFVDCHTHACWAGDRCQEFDLKIKGASYMDIYQSGGGIHSTVKAVRQASEDELYEMLMRRLNTMIRHGTTTVEVKSGYGLDTENELKMLRVIERARKSAKIRVLSTFCGPHAVPEDAKNAREHTKYIVEHMIPAVKQAEKVGEISVNQADIFIEKGVFELDDSETILKSMRDNEFSLNVHVDELNPLKGSELAIKYEAACISHLEEISDEAIAALEHCDTVAAILPTTAYALRLKLPPAKKMLQSGAIVALGSDYNPNAHCFSMPLVMNLACTTLRMTCYEALVAATLNSAHALTVSDICGSLHDGKKADFLILNTQNWKDLIYQMGSARELIHSVWVAGEKVETNG